MVRTVTIGAFIVAMGGCYDPLTKQPVNTVEWDARNVRGYIETIEAVPDEALVWDLRIAGGIARWRECTSVSQCSGIEHEGPAAEILATARVGHAATAGGAIVEVLRLSLVPRRKYIVPTTPTPLKR